MDLLILIVVVLLLVWAFGAFVPSNPFYGNQLVHFLLVLIVVLVILRLLGVAI